MLLAVDIGNTHIVLGLYADDELRSHWRLSTRKETTSDELGTLIRGLFQGGSLDAGEVSGMIVSSVVPDLNRVWDEAGRCHFDVKPLFVGPGVKTGLPIHYDNPHEVGADRIVNAVAAVERHGAPVIVVDFGTATTFDVVGPDADYLGGIIAPGLGLSAQALVDRAARLHQVDVKRPPQVIGRTTEQSLQSGLFHGYAALVEGLIRRIHEELGRQTPVIATGGLARGLESELASLTAVEDDLTLEGLRLIWKKNAR